MIIRDVERFFWRGKYYWLFLFILVFVRILWCYIRELKWEVDFEFFKFVKIREIGDGEKDWYLKCFLGKF